MGVDSTRLLPYFVQIGCRGRRCTVRALLAGVWDPCIRDQLLRVLA
jgi:hypothetical protein